jgi:energy-coupling factor transport system ATP-binding protein
MAVQDMRLELNCAEITRGNWRLSAQGIFTEGIHLVSGDVGSGKSTLALMMAGLLPPVSGSVIREQVSDQMVSFQFPEYHITGTTVNEECASWGHDPETILSSIRLSDKGDSDPFRLSRGEMKRFHLACVLANPYDLLILDEPFSSLDVCEKQRICRCLSDRSRGITVIFTHEQTIFPRVTHIWEIHAGRLRYCGSPPEGLLNWHHAPPLIRKLIDAGKTPKNITPDDLTEAACAT